ncbi:tRNA (guanine-N(7)-)-methyltransferase subunit TRM82, partial [Tremellales sp. Uapishka_1]
MTTPFPIISLASSSSSILATSGSSIHIYSPSVSKIISYTPESPESEAIIRLSAVSQDGKLAVTVGDDKSIRVWEISEDAVNLKSSRTATKKASKISFSPDGNILLSDKVGDLYQYPIDPAIDPSIPRPQLFALAADPTINPDAELVLGHVSVLTSHLITPDGKHIISADRDEHIRVSRYPKAYVIERYLLGTEGFISSIHIPTSQPTRLLSAGGSPALNIWDWTTGALLSSIDVYPSVLPHRRVRADLRKSKMGRKKLKGTADLVAPKDLQEDPTKEDWYSAPENWLLPSGQGVNIKKIESLIVQGKEIVIFFSEGCSAIHSFALPSDAETTPEIETLALPYPILDFTLVPGSSQILLSLDTAWGVLKANLIPGQQQPCPDSLSDDQLSALRDVLRVIELSPDAKVRTSLPCAFT